MINNDVVKTHEDLIEAKDEEINHLNENVLTEKKKLSKKEEIFATMKKEKEEIQEKLRGTGTKPIKSDEITCTS